jgi:hypothetical protein
MRFPSLSRKYNYAKARSKILLVKKNFNISQNKTVILCEISYPPYIHTNIWFQLNSVINSFSLHIQYSLIS